MYSARNVTELRSLFWQHMRDYAPDLAKHYRKTWRQNRYPADVRMAWIDFIDAEHRRGQISDSLASRATL